MFGVSSSSKLCERGAQLVYGARRPPAHTRDIRSSPDLSAAARYERHRREDPMWKCVRLVDAASGRRPGN